jgi:hypothetical protein
MTARFQIVCPFLCFSIAAICGWLIWQFSVPITGEIEPWDSQAGYYSISLIAIGFVAACVCPRLFWLAPIGLFLGQILYMEMMYDPGPGPIIMPSWLGVPFFSAIPAFIGAFAGYGVAKLITGIVSSPKPNDA